MSTTNVQAQEAEDINLKELVATIRRQWSFVLAGLALGGFAAALTTSRIKPTWEGSFEIVLAPKGQSTGSTNVGSSNILANLAGLSGISRQGSELATEVKILESASVLRPVFEEVRALKAAQGEDITGYNFNSWKRKLTIALEKGTSVLSISYRDSDQNLIIPALNSLSSAYQKYSIHERIDSLEKAVKYAQEQSHIYRERSDASFRALNSFGLTYGIASNSNTGGGGLDISKLLGRQNSNATSLSLDGVGRSSIKPNGSDPLAQLAQLNQELIRLEKTFTANDPAVIALKRERNALQRYIETSAFGSIAYPGKEVITKKQAQSILIRHQELERKANRDQSILNSMEAALLSLQLEKARGSTPWQLISTPTLLEWPIEPRPYRNLAIGIASGIILGCASGVIAEKRSGKVFNKEQLEELLQSQPLLELRSDQSNTWNDGLQLLGLNNTQDGNIAILPLGEVERSQMNRARDILKQTSKNNVEIFQSTLEATRFDKLLLMAAPGSIAKPQLNRLIQELDLQRAPIIGWIWFY